MYLEDKTGKTSFWLNKFKPIPNNLIITKVWVQLTY